MLGLRPIKVTMTCCSTPWANSRGGTTCGQLAEHQQTMPISVTEYLGRYSPAYPIGTGYTLPSCKINHFIQSRKWVYVSWMIQPGAGTWGQAYGMRVLYYFILYRTFESTSHHQSRYTGRQTIGRQILCGARIPRSHHGVYQSGY